MAFRYINPGYMALLGADNDATEVTGTEYSKTGVGFYQTTFPSYTKRNIDLPTFVVGDDFWARFDVYIPDLSSGYLGIYCGIPNKDVRYTAHINLRNYSETDSDSARFSLYNASSNYGTLKYIYVPRAELGIKKSSVNSFVIHVKYGDSNTAKMELIPPSRATVTLENVSYLEATGAFCKSAHLYCTNSAVIFSNVIMSDEEISPKEQVIALPLSTLATETDMTAGASGLYIANSANQTLLQTVDVSELIASYGASSAVTGIAVVGNPAYKTATGLASLIGLSKNGATVTEHGTCELSDDTEATIVDGWSVENMTIAGMSGMQFGWKVGT